MDLDELLAEYMRQVDKGLTDRDAFLRAHPEAAEALRELLDMEDTVLRLAGPVEPVESDEESDELGEQNGDPQATQSMQLAAVEEDTLPTENANANRDANSSSKPPLAHLLEKGMEHTVSFGNYELLEIIGRGGMGVVYRARQKGLNRDVAVKMILNSQLASDEDIQRFYTEARAAANIRHDNVVDIYEIGEFESQHYFSMELVEGSDLSQMVREGRLESRRAARLLRAAASAVQAAHDRDLLHRDIKPANILVDEQDRVVVTDFGLAREVSEEDKQRLTATGLAMGTPSYMSPEQAGGRRDLMGPTTDVFSLGTVLFAMLTGGPPHRGETVMDTLMSVIHQPPEHPTRLNAEADPALSRICLKCLEKDLSARYQSAQELVDDLDRYLEGEQVLAQGASRPVRAMRWAGQIPVVAAICGKHSHHPTRGQLRAQAGLILLVLLSVVALAAYPSIRDFTHNRMPSRVTIAGGIHQGAYRQFATSLAAKLADAEITAHVTESTGSGANRADLISGNAQLALLQESLVGGDDIAVIAPVFDELVHVIVKSDRIQTWTDLTNATIAIGDKGSGMADAANLVLDGVGAKLVFRKFTQLAIDETLDAAVVTIGRGSEALKKSLQQPGLRLLPLSPDVIERLSADPRFRPVRIPGPAESIATVATPAFLACRRDAADALIRATLEHLYPPLSPHQMSLDEAKNWSFMPLHREARKFFDTQQR